MMQPLFACLKCHKTLSLGQTYPALIWIDQSHTLMYYKIRRCTRTRKVELLCTDRH